MKRVSVLAAAALITFSAVSSSYAIIGLGLHYGLDFSMSMEPGKDNVSVAGFDLDSIKISGLTLPTDRIIGKDTPFLKMSRSKLERSALNFGGKFFVDIVPYVDIIEGSFNLGVWQYDGKVEYLNVKGISNAAVADPSLTLSEIPKTYEPVAVTLDAYDMSYFGLSKTPYAKLNLDLSVRKIVLNLWLVKFNAGAGMSVHFATPILDEALIDGVKADKGIKSPEELVTEFMKPNSKMGKAIVQKILDELYTPRWGAHIVAGANLKLPTFPLGVYVDGKLMIPISKFDENKQVNALGVLINTGLALQF
jgi:hypothetical protein